MFSPVNGVRPQTVNGKGASFLEWHAARIGTSVGVLDRGRRAGQGRLGTIVQTYGHPEYLAVDVRFEDGSVELYWHYQLQTMEGQPLP